MVAPSRYEFLSGPSTDPSTPAALKKLLGDRKVDLLFIDGDHTYEVASSDFMTYLPFMGSPSVIAMHDINMLVDSQCHPGKRMVGYFWNEVVKKGYRYMETSASLSRAAYGIGAVAL